MSPTPTGPSFSNTQAAASLFSGINSTTPAFGANGANGVQEQQTFTAPSSNTFNFSASTGMNPFAATGSSNPFTTQNSSTPFGQQASAGTPSNSIFGQPALPQTSSNPFGAASNFAFGQSSGVNNSFPPTQNTSIFFKSTPASSSFAFGSNPTPNQTSTFGAPAQSSPKDISMEASESPFKGLAKSAAPGQTAESKPAPTLFGGPTSFSFKPTSNDSSGDIKTQPPQLSSSLFQPKTTAAEQQISSPSSNVFQPSKPTNEGTSEKLPSQAPSTVFNFFPKPTESKEKSNEMDGTLSTQAANPFAAFKSTDKINLPEVKPGTPFLFGTSSERSQTKNPEKSSAPKTQDDPPFNPFQALRSSSNLTASTQSSEQTSGAPASQPSQPSQSVGPSHSKSFPPPKETNLEQTPPSSASNAFQPPKSTRAEEPQTAAPFSPFQTMNSANAQEPRQEAAQSARPVGSLFQTLNQNTEARPKATQLPPTHELNHTSQASIMSESTANSKQAGPSTNNQSTSASISTSTYRKSGPAATPEIPPIFDRSLPSNPVTNGKRQVDNSDFGNATRNPSQTSNLFVETLKQSSTTTPQPALNQAPSQPQTERRTVSPTKPTTAPSDEISNLPAVAAPLASATEPFVVKVKSHGSSNVPQELDNNDFADFDKSYRLRSLNARFKKQIADLDPSHHDFEPLIRFYATQREAIGYPLGGLYHRVKAGEKRKTEEGDRVERAPNAVKRTKLDITAVSSNQQEDRPVFGFRAITSVSTSPKPATAGSPAKTTNGTTLNPHMTSNNSAVLQPAPATSNTSNVFMSMLSSTEPPLFETKDGFQSTSSPSKPASFMSVLKPTGQPNEQASSVDVLAMNSKTPASQLGAQSNNSTTAFSNINGLQNASQPRGPKSSGPSTLDPPKFASAGGMDFMAAFAAQAKKNAAKMEAENKAKRKAEEFDSDEDDEAEYERRVVEEDRAKRAKIEAIAKAGSGFTPVLSSASSVNGVSPAAEQDGESTRDASGEGTDRSRGEDESESQDDEIDGEDDEEQEEDGEEDDDDDSGDDDDIQTAMAKSHAKAKNPFESSSDPNSLFNRISRPGAPPQEKDSKTVAAPPPSQVNNNSVLSGPPGTGLFGSRPTTPNLDSPKGLGTSIFSNAGSSTPTGDNTWKPGSAIKFGTATSAPTVNITPATPLARTNGNAPQNPFSTFTAANTTSVKSGPNDDDDTPKASIAIFGASSFLTQTAARSASDSSKPFSNLFGDASKKTPVNQSSAAHVGFSFGVPNQHAASPLLAPSNISSAITSRATSPGLTDNESAAESGIDDQGNDPQSDYMASRPGEENEDVLFEVRTKALESMSEKELNAVGSKDEPGWKTRGVGPLRVLRNSDTGRTRIVMRSEPGANVVVNSPLIRENNYNVTISGAETASLRMSVFMNGKMKSWVFKVKTAKIAHELVDCLVENEPSDPDSDEE
jgi:RanBP1 domain